jgi:hypothetical protein|tara:strand:- start:2995 stop:3252 length:258 start_codon:yes stop_codon:yes gene_type:complete
MKLEKNPDDFVTLFDEIDYDSPLTDDELDYLDIIGKDFIRPHEVERFEGFSSGEDFIEYVKKEVDIFDAPGVELVSINDYEISGS